MFVSACVPDKVTTEESMLSVTLPLVPPPVRPVPATTAVMSPWGMAGKVIRLPSPLIYSAAVPLKLKSKEPDVVMGLLAIAIAPPVIVAPTLVTVPPGLEELMVIVSVVSSAVMVTLAPATKVKVSSLMLAIMVD